MIKTYQFNTGVRPFDHDPPAGMAFMDGYIDSGNGVYVIPFQCEEVPVGYSFKFSCDNPNMDKEQNPFCYSGNIIRRDILPGSAMMSKYAYFVGPIKEN